MQDEHNFLIWILVLGAVTAILLVSGIAAIVIGHHRKTVKQTLEWGLHLLRAQEGERQKIAMELHDDVVQRLTMLQMQLHRPENEGSSNLVAAIAHTLRSMAHELYPATLLHLTLGGALSDLAEKATTDKIRFSVECDQVMVLPDKLKVEFFRVAQEAVQNILKHSQAEAASIRLSLVDHFVEMTVQDNGGGFVSNGSAESSFGLRSMRERLVNMGGSLTVRSELGTGTSITARVHHV